MIILLGAIRLVRNLFFSVVFFLLLAFCRYVFVSRFLDLFFIFLLLIFRCRFFTFKGLWSLINLRNLLLDF